MPLTKDFREFIELLNSNGVEYLVVGAFALAHHGYPRYTGDIDILVRPTPENADRMIQTLNHFGFSGLGLTSQDFSNPDNIVQLGVAPNRIDLVTAISGMTFEEAWASRSEGDLDGLIVPFIGREALIKNKKSTGRAKDLGDIDELQKLR
jgi:hypothetical protein